MLLTALVLTALTPGQVDLVLGPQVQQVPAGTIVDITLTAKAGNPPTVESFTAIDAILSWDPTELDFVSADASSYPWFVAGFLPDPDGINLDVQDGEALYTVLASVTTPATVPPDILVVTFKFKVLESGVVSLAPSAGTFGKTRVLGTAPNREITGDISAFATVLTESENYCTAGISASGCQADLSTAGIPSATATSGFVLNATSVEGSKVGTFYFGTNGRQANPWGNGSSYQCVIPPVIRTGLQSERGTNNNCDGFFNQDLNALWCSTCSNPAKNPGAGAVVQAQLWYRDPQSTSNQTTSLSNAIEFTVGP